jgi:hypothetical protein
MYPDPQRLESIISIRDAMRQISQEADAIVELLDARIEAGHLDGSRGCARSSRSYPVPKPRNQRGSRCLPGTALGPVRQHRPSDCGLYRSRLAPPRSPSSTAAGFNSLVTP